MYAMIMVRLVNGIVDAAQPQKQARSVQGLAQDLKWPGWFVDIRHEATHKHLPALPLLRLAAKEALEQLLSRFWRPQLAKLNRRRKYVSTKVTSDSSQRQLVAELR